MQLLRGFQAGKLRPEATALIIQQLPGLIRQLVKNEEHIKALVLAKQNKHLFVQGWLDTSLLYDLARAYSRLGMAEQASQTYRYLFEVSDETTKENIYLPLIKELFASRFYLQVEEYADRYQLRYPKGKDLTAIHLFKVQALYASGQSGKALALINAASSPRLQELELLKGRIYFETKEWQKVIDTLNQSDIRQVLPKNALLWLAESYYQSGKETLAEPLFEQLRTQTNSEQAQFRLAQIAAKQDKTTQALKQFKELADKGSDPLWTKLAREEAAILALPQK
jgi:tetratricopeptide (TPR) repeat protein